MPRVQFREERCKGCLLCTTVCPKGIIVQAGRINAQGYKVAEIAAEDMASCTGCASCARICPDFAIQVFKAEEVKPAAAKKAKPKTKSKIKAKAG